MAHKKATGSTRLGRDSRSQRLGLKIYGDQFAKAGNIIIRQHGMKYDAAEGVGIGSDNTLFALKDGIVKFKKTLKKSFTGAFHRKTTVMLAPLPENFVKKSK